MAFTFTLKALNAPPGVQCLTTFNDLIQKIPKFIQVVSPEGLSGLIIDESEPGVDDRDKAWIQLEDNGKPVGLFVYADEWTLVPALHVGAIIAYSGLVSAIPDGWVLCDGTNGTPDITDNTNFASWWQPNYNVSETEYVLCPIYFKGHAT